MLSRSLPGAGPHSWRRAAHEKGGIHSFTGREVSRFWEGHASVVPKKSVGGPLKPAVGLSGGHNKLNL